MVRPLVLSLKKLSEILYIENATTEIIISDNTNIICTNPARLKRVDGFLVCICTKGNAIIEINSKEENVTIGSIITLGPYQYFKFKTYSEDFALKLIGFTKGFLATNELNIFLIELFQLNEMTFSPVVKPRSSEINLLLNLFEAIFQLCQQRNNSVRFEVIRHVVCAVLYLIREAYKKHKILFQYKTGRKEEILIQFHYLVFKYCNKYHNNRFYAEKIFITSKYLSKVIKELTGRSSREIIDDALVVEARILLQSPMLSISDVAHDLGFSDQSFFAKFFKKHTGYSPGEFRKSYLNTKLS